MNNAAASEPLAPRRIWLTGADGEIGRALADKLLRTGHALALTAVDPTQLLDLAERHPAQVLLVPGDIQRSRQLQDMADLIVAQWGALDCAICLDKRFTGADSVAAQASAAPMLEASLYMQEALLLLRHGHRPHLLGVATFANQIGADLCQVFAALSVDLVDEGIEVSMIDLCGSQSLEPDNAAQRVVEHLARSHSSKNH
jgi:NAD(P)-dependent dehydrogenase (short-subunit alcohol dehydrogenase family)